MPHPSVLKPLGTPFTELQSVDSTNNYALRQIHAGLAQHGAAYFAHEQLAGKGQMGKKWVAEKDHNVVLSIIANPNPLRLPEQFYLSAAVALAVHDLFAKYAGDDTKIKWPNDLYWQDRKAGGILIESIVGNDGTASSNWKWAVIGVGLNINQTVFPPGLANPVSLKQITGKSFDVLALSKELCQCLDKRFTELLNADFGAIHAQYLVHLYKRNETVKLKKDNRVFDATIQSVSTAGRLIVQHGIEEEFSLGEVEWIR